MLFVLACCAPPPKFEVAALPTAEVEAKLAEADSLTGKGCYIGFKKAALIYDELYSFPSLKKNVAARLVRNALLLALREKEIGIWNRTYIDKAFLVIKENPSLAAYELYANIVASVWPKAKGAMRDIGSIVSSWPSTENLSKAQNELKTKWPADEFAAYIFAMLSCSYPYLLQEKKDPAEILPFFPESPLLKFKSATCLQPVPERLEELIRVDPEFYEAHYFLGEAALARGKLLEAEQHYLKAWEGIAESAQIPITVASIYFATEELDRSIEFYDKTLALAPEYREAMLGKAICLSLLGKHDEAMSILANLISLGYLLMGESHYWMAWNLHGLKRLGEAAENIEQSKGRLPTDTNVFALAGTISFERGDIAAAENNFQEALKYNPANTDALYSLGNLYAQKKDWLGSGAYFEKAAGAFAAAQGQIRERMSRIEQSNLAPERKDKLLLKKKAQLERTLLTEATAFYNAAAGYYNAGEKAKALTAAMRAASHSSFKEKGEDLILQIKAK